MYVTGFTINTRASGTGTAKVYAKDGDYVGFEGNQAAWTLIYEKSVTSPGANTDLGKLDLALLVPANTFKSFHVWTSLGIRYTNGSGEGNVFSQTPGEIIFYEGKGAGGEFGNTFSPRVWNGEIEYGFDNGPAPTPPPSTANPTPPPSTANPTSTSTTVATVLSPVVATFDSSFSAPRCSSVTNSCNSGELLKGTAANLEGGISNTLDGCSDGLRGAYQFDESVDKLTVTSVGGGPLQAGGRALIEAQVYAYGSMDTADFYYTEDANAASPVWVYLASVSAPDRGSFLISLEYTLPNTPSTSTTQGVRVNFRYFGSISSCSGGNWDDTDDLVFAVATGVSGARASGAELQMEAGAAEDQTPKAKLVSGSYRNEPLNSTVCGDIMDRERCVVSGMCKWKRGKLFDGSLKQQGCQAKV